MSKAYDYFLFRPLDADRASKGYDDEGYVCTHCRSKVRGRVVAEGVQDGGMWGGAVTKICVCNCGGVTAVYDGLGGVEGIPAPLLTPIQADKRWPPDYVRFFQEAARCFSSDFFTATAMLCRRLLMVCACEYGAKERQGFEYYVDHLVDEVVKDEATRESLNGMRKIGNYANHRLEEVTKEGAAFALESVKHLLTLLFSAPKPPTVDSE